MVIVLNYFSIPCTTGTTNCTLEYSTFCFTWLIIIVMFFETFDLLFFFSCCFLCPLWHATGFQLITNCTESDYGFNCSFLSLQHCTVYIVLYVYNFPYWSMLEWMGYVMSIILRKSWLHIHNNVIFLKRCIHVLLVKPKLYPVCTHIYCIYCVYTICVYIIWFVPQHRFQSILLCVYFNCVFDHCFRTIFVSKYDF